MNDPYRQSCPRCAELDALIEKLKNPPMPVYPNQGPPDDEPHPRCVMCGDELKWQHDREDWYCDEHERVATVEEGFLWWKRTTTATVNVGCPPYHHLHRTCEACGAEWIEMPRATPVPGSP